MRIAVSVRHDASTQVSHPNGGARLVPHGRRLPRAPPMRDRSRGYEYVGATSASGTCLIAGGKPPIVARPWSSANRPSCGMTKESCWRGAKFTSQRRVFGTFWSRQMAAHRQSLPPDIPAFKCGPGGWARGCPLSRRQLLGVAKFIGPVGDLTLPTRRPRSSVQYDWGGRRRQGSRWHKLANSPANSPGIHAPDARHRSVVVKRIAVVISSLARRHCPRRRRARKVGAAISRARRLTRLHQLHAARAFPNARSRAVLRAPAQTVFLMGRPICKCRARRRRPPIDNHGPRRSCDRHDDAASAPSVRTHSLLEAVVNNSTPRGSTRPATAS